jgi:hypothetical protein
MPPPNTSSAGSYKKRPGPQKDPALIAYRLSVIGYRLSTIGYRTSDRSEAISNG